MRLSQILLFLANTVPVLFSKILYPEERSDLQQYQDGSKCFPNFGKWYMMYRNYYLDPIIGGAAKCVAFERYGAYENFSTPATFSYGKDGSTIGEFTLTSSPCYEGKNMATFKPYNSTFPPESIHIIYTDCTCYVGRHDYADNGNGCTFWRRADKLNEPADCCEFIYAENCGTSPKYQIYDSSCQSGA
ncbi:uncharacterized protein LOC144105728 [Amblyomma americanum]